MPEPLPVICLAGPTGAGKTALAIELADRYGLEIINADSRQIYRDFPIITAQPSAEELAAAPHHLYGFAETCEKLGAGQWARLARAKCARILERGKRPLLVGGTGFYFRALLEPMAQIPQTDPEISQKIAERMAAEGPESLHKELLTADPDYAAAIHPHDRQRIMRALEVLQGTGRTFSWWHAHSRPAPQCAGPLYVAGTSLAELAPRLATRIDMMIESGALQEAEKALARHPDLGLPGWQGIGAREAAGLLRGEMSLEECKRQWLANTRAYAKRQLTWFRGKKAAVWIRADSGAEEIPL